MRLHPINDGVTRRPDERGVTNAPFYHQNPDGSPFRNRESLATEIARRSTGEPVAGARTATMVNGTAYSFTTDRFGNEVDKRVERTTDLGDDPLPRVAFRRPRKSASVPTVKSPRVVRGAGRPTRNTANGTDRNAAVDRFIRTAGGQGYSGPITPQMRRLARDAMSHRASVAAYVNG